MIKFKLFQKTNLISNKQFFFNSLVLYYWILMYVLPVDGSLQRLTPLYFATILPIYVYILLNLNSIIRHRWKKNGVSLMIFIILVTVISVLRFDVSTIIKLSSVSLIILILIKKEINLSTGFLNFIFILSIVAGILSYYYGTNKFGFIPGMSKANLLEGLGWRVSIFNSVPNSAFFSLLIFIINIFGKKELNINRVLILLLSIYFLVLSGSRTAILIFTNIIIIRVVIYYYGFYNVRKFMVLGFSLLSFSLSIFYFNSFALDLYKLDNEFINSLVFKSKDVIKNKKELEKNNYRTWIWKKHISIYLNKPIFGNGDYNIKSFLLEKEKTNKTNFSESFLTDTLVKVGLLIIPFLLFFYFTMKASIEDNHPVIYCITISLIILLLSYGSFFVSYNFMFLVFVGRLFESDNYLKSHSNG